VKVEKLARNFKKEISAAKVRLKNIKAIKDDEGGVAENTEEETAESAQPEEAREQEDDAPVFSANLGKDDKGMQVYDASSGSGGFDDKIGRVLGEAEALFAQEDYDGASDKLEEAGSIIDRIDDGGGSDSEALIESGGATTTEEADGLGVGEEAGADAATSTEE